MRPEAKASTAEFFDCHGDLSFVAMAVVGAAGLLPPRKKSLPPPPPLNLNFVAILQISAVVITNETITRHSNIFNVDGPWDSILVVRGGLMKYSFEVPW